MTLKETRKFAGTRMAFWYLREMIKQQCHPLTTKGEVWNVTVTPMMELMMEPLLTHPPFVVVNSIPVVNSAEITPTDALNLMI